MKPWTATSYSINTMSIKTNRIRLTHFNSIKMRRKKNIKINKYNEKSNERWINKFIYAVNYQAKYEKEKKNEQQQHRRTNRFCRRQFSQTYIFIHRCWYWFYQYVIDWHAVLYCYSSVLLMEFAASVVFVVAFVVVVGCNDTLDFKLNQFDLRQLMNRICVDQIKHD